MKKLLPGLRSPSVWLLSTILAIGPGCQAPPEPVASDAFARTMNLGKAHLENRSARDAVAAFTLAVELAPDSGPALRNLARAYFLARDDAAALEALERVEQPGNEVATSYLKGLAAAHQARLDDAQPHFEEAVRLDPHTATLRFQLANTYQAAGRYEEALEQLLATVELDPLHTGAHYNLVFHARRSRDREEIAARRRELTRLRKLLGDENRTPEMLERCAYTAAETVTAETVTAADPVPAETPAVRFVDATQEMFRSEDDRAALAGAVAAAVLDVDEAGRLVLFMAGSDGASLVTPSADGGFQRSAITLKLAGGIQVLVGNFHDDVPEGTDYNPAIDAQNDVLVLARGGVRLLRKRGPEDFEDVTAQAGLDGVAGRRGRWVDYENDGDLDLLLAGDQGLQLWQNNGDGRFEEATAAVGIDAAEPAWDAVAVELDGNLAVDVVVARGSLPTLVFDNQRTGTFEVRPDPPGPWPAARRVLANDLDHDAHPDAVLVGEDAVVIVPGRSPERQHLDLAGIEPSSAVLLDFDNDGSLDLAVAGSDRGAPDQGRLALWRNAGPGAWTDATESAGLAATDLAAVRDVLAADLDADGDTDLVLLTATGLRFLSNDGGNVRRQLKVRLVGTKTNPTGLGARLEVRSGRFRHSRTVHELPVEIGLGAHESLDSVQVLWTNGIVDNKIDVTVPDAALTVLEKNVATGSCPFLYAWDGGGFRFVTDILGNSPMGLSITRGVPLDADPDELVRLGGGEDFVPRDGAYVVQVTEEMREVLYLDAARLVAVDHDPGVEVHATDKLMPAPFPPSQLVPLGALRSPSSVLSDDGVDRGAALLAVDGRFAPPGVPLPPPFRGMTRPLALTLDFGPLETSRPLVLALTGWLQYGDASTNIALSQGPSERVVPPRLEAQGADGRWRTVDVVVGMPAGKTKTILVDLDGKLPDATRRLRLVGSFEIRWDRIALAERLAASSVEQHTVLPTAANLAWRGFSEIRSRAPGHPTTPEFAAVAHRPPWRTALQGWVTRYGNVLELVRARDERLALLSAGDALELSFDAAALPTVPEGKTRTFFFYSVGWDKDGDVNVIDGDAVEPLPVAVSGDWQVRFNTRWVPWDRFHQTSDGPPLFW